MAHSERESQGHCQHTLPRADGWNSLATTRLRGIADEDHRPSPRIVPRLLVRRRSPAPCVACTRRGRGVKG